jgi:myo-inositol-1(or 4)-monophosphatase
MTDIEVAIAAAEAGATVLRHRFGELFERLDKGAGDFTTSADIAAEDAMLAVLRQACPNDVVLAEESGRTGSSGSTRRWLLDPLCGTLNYVARMRVAAVNVALRDDERFLAAAVADPFNHEVYWTDMSSAFVRSACRDVRLVPDASSRLVDLNLDPPFANAPVFRVVSLAGHSKFAASFRPRAVSTSLALAWVATGQRAAYITDGDLRDSVHFSAGIALCQAAGCVVTDLLGFPPGNGAKGLLAAANPETHAALLGIVKTIWLDAWTPGA